MIEKRRFQRVQFQTPCRLLVHDTEERGQLETLSLNGAMVSFKESVMVPEGESCDLQVFLDGRETPLCFRVTVVYSTLFRLHVRFDNAETETNRRLYRLLRSLVSDPETLRQELQLLPWDTTGW